MNPLEDRYRRLLHLLPEEHRAARGDELLGLLLDLDDGRTRPSTRQAVGLIGLAIRLRLAALPAVGDLLFSGFLVYWGTAAIGQLINTYSTARSNLPLLLHTTAILVPLAVAQLGVLVAWILGARRTAVTLYAVVLGSFCYLQLHLTHRQDIGIPRFWATLLIGAPRLRVAWLISLTVLAVLSAAVWRRWATPRPRWLWLVATVLGVLSWKAWARHGIYYPPALPPHIGPIVAATAAAVGLILLRRQPWPVAVAGALVGLGIGWFLPSVLLLLDYSRYGCPPTIALGIVLAVSLGKLLMRQLSDRPAQSQPEATP